MKKVVLVLVLVAVMMMTAPAYAGSKSDKQLATDWASAHGGGYTIEKVTTVSKGGTKGKVKGTSYTVKYPKKVKKGKKVTVYMIEKNGDIKAMACLGKVK